jgi:hypothetical protein
MASVGYPWRAVGRQGLAIEIAGRFLLDRDPLGRE